MVLECRDEGGPCVGVAVPRRVVKSAARVGGRSVMMCGDDGGNVLVLKK